MRADQPEEPRLALPELEWRVRARTVALTRPFVLGILNVTPDSFSDGGRFASLASAMVQARRMVAEGADGIDVGGESTRPQGAVSVAPAEEVRRVLPVVTELRKEFPDLVLSVDTTKGAVAAAALDVGTDVVNDVSALRLDSTLGQIAGAYGAGVILMHSRGGVSEMGTYRHAEYREDVVAEVADELRSSVDSAMSAGVARESIVLDPGIGFAKRSDHSLRILSEIGRLVPLGFPIMVGVSRKRFVGELSGVERAEDRIAGTVGANVVALTRGARLFRVHDVAPNRQALDVAWAILQADRASPSATN